MTTTFNLMFLVMGISKLHAEIISFLFKYYFMFLQFNMILILGENAVQFLFL